MPIEIIVPRLGWSMEEGAFVAWLKKDGEFVRPGEPLFSIEGDKAIQEIESIDSGILRIVPNGPKPGDPIRVGNVLGHLVSDSESQSAPASTSKAATKSSEAPQISRLSNVDPPVPSENAARSKSGISPRALRVAAELGVDWTTLIGSGRTGRIRERDVRAAGISRTPARPT